MVNREKDLKTALIEKEETENRLAKLEKMRSEKYLNDEVHESLKGEYAIIKDRSDYLTSNLEELKSSQLINQDQYNALKNEYASINESAAKLLANKSEARISEEQYEELRKEYTKKQNYCALTSTKTNFGHTFAASGLVSLISLVQAMRHETIPASLHCEEENDYINWKESPFYVNKTKKPWTKREGKSRTGAVSAFGMSGTNVHMVIRLLFRTWRCSL